MRGDDEGVSKGLVQNFLLIYLIYVLKMTVGKNVKEER